MQQVEQMQECCISRQVKRKAEAESPYGCKGVWLSSSDQVSFTAMRSPTAALMIVQGNCSVPLLLA